MSTFRNLREVARTFLLSFSILACAPMAAQAQADTAGASNWPQRSIRMVVPFPAGGATDVVARILAERAGAELGQQIVVENKTGAGGTIGAADVAKSGPDGYTILLTTSST